MRKWLARLRSLFMGHYEYIGYVRVAMDDYSHKTNNHCNIGLYLNSRGKRRYKELGIPAYSDMYKSGLSDVVLWTEGGPFPDGFVPKEDAIRVMLEKLIDESIVGRK